MLTRAFKALPDDALCRPTVHLNGTARIELRRAYLKAFLAIQNAETDLAACFPHGRDYYPQAADMLPRATDQHRERMASIAAIRQEIESLIIGLDS